MASTDTQKAETTSTNDRSVMGAVCIGAILGGVWGWFYLTSRGATVRDRLDPAVDRIVDALEKVQGLRAAVKSLAVLMLVVGCLSIPRVARAQAFVVPWIGGNAGVPSGVGPIGFGAAVGASAARIVDFGVDFGYSPSDGGGVIRRSLLTTMGDVTFGVPFGRHGGPQFRPFVTAGVGLIRSRFQPVFVGDDVTRDDFGEAFGGGVEVYPAHHFGVRADLQYFHPINCWRTSIGMVIR